MRHAKRVDANQADIVAALRARGWSVRVTSDIGKGFPDLTIMRLDDGWWRGHLIEVKDGAKPKSKRQLTPDEIEMHDWLRAAGASVVVVETVADVEAL